MHKEKVTKRCCVLAVLIILSANLQNARSQQAKEDPKPRLYVVATSHLDSQWNWTVQDTIREFVPNTFFENFKRFEKYPAYTFNYEGAIHYMWFKEYYPEAWPTVQKYVADGRWRLAGSWINAVDVNVPSAESLMRQALYGKRFFRQEFGKVSQDVYLPDCFGFGFALPSIATHSGLSQFSTQKLTWGSSYGIPFPIGRWKGVDGSTVVAALNPGDYVTKIRSDISVDPKWATERASVAAELFAGRQYPSERLREAWIRVLWHQFHDDLTGTSIPQAYQFSWNDELVSANQFASVLTSSASAVAELLDTRGAGIPLVVYNPLATARRDPVEATVEFKNTVPASIRVVDRATQRDVPLQVLER